MLSVHKASFSRTPQGIPYITMDDASFARAEIVFIDPTSLEVSGMIGDVQFSFGTIPPELARSFIAHAQVILTAPHPLGHDVVLSAPVLSLH